MKKDKTRFTADRRMFLKGAAVAGGTAALTAVSATGLVDPATTAQAAPDATDKTGFNGLSRNSTHQGLLPGTQVLNR